MSRGKPSHYGPAFHPVPVEREPLVTDEEVKLLCDIRNRAFLSVKLTSRELEVATLILKGIPYSEIGRMLNMSLKTVRTHAFSIYSKCHINCKDEFFYFIFPT